MLDNRAAGRWRLGVEPECLADVFDHALVRARFFQVVLPFLLQVRVLGAAQGGKVDLLAAALGFDHLVDQLVQLLGVVFTHGDKFR